MFRLQIVRVYITWYYESGYLQWKSVLYNYDMLTIYSYMYMYI